MRINLEPPRRAQNSAGTTVDAEAAAVPEELTRAEAGKRTTQQMYDSWVELEAQYRVKQDGTKRTRHQITSMIAKNPLAVHPRTKEPPTSENVRRQLSAQRSKLGKK